MYLDIVRRSTTTHPHKVSTCSTHFNAHGCTTRALYVVYLYTAFNFYNVPWTLLIWAEVYFALHVGLDEDHGRHNMHHVTIPVFDFVALFGFSLHILAREPLRPSDGSHLSAITIKYVSVTIYTTRKRMAVGQG